MDGQDHGKNHLPGHDSHGVHVCHKCGWPFPNQHPSSRHRRAHKRVCGTLEGYKLLEAELDIHSDDEDLSDDDRNTPSPKLVDRDVKEKGTVGIAQGSIKQGDEKSLETGRKLAENVEKTTENDPDYAKLLKNGHGKMRKPEVPECMTILPGTIPKSEDDISNSSISAIACSLSDSRKEESPIEVSDDDRSSTCGLKRISSDTARDVSQDSDIIGTDARTADCSTPYLGEETNAREKEQTNLHGNYADVLVSLIDNSGETSAAVSVVQKTEEIITDFVPAEETLQLREEHSDGFGTKMSMGELSHKVEDFTGLQSRDFNGSFEFSASEMPVFENDLKQQRGSSEPIEEEVPVQKEDDRLQMKVTTVETKVSDDLESDFYALVTDRQKAREVYPSKDKSPHDYFSQEKAIGKEDHAESTIITESATDFNKCQSNLESNFIASDHVSNQQKGEILKCNVYFVDGTAGKFVSSPDKKVSLNTEATLHKTEVVPDDVINVSRMKLNEECCYPCNAMDVVLTECVGGTSATEANEVMDTKLLQRDTKGQMGQPIPHSVVKSSVQNAAAFADNCDRDVFWCAGNIRSESSPGEFIDNFVEPEFGKSTPDVSIDSNSQTDALEGHGRSATLLSTQSDITAITETEPFTSTDSRASAQPGTTSLKNLEITSEGQCSDTSENFEPPSFITLVEPIGAVDQKADTSRVQMVQNSAQPETLSTQLVWFPSLTHVVTEPQGRKRNEENIANVTNWSTGRQHAPLKSLLSKAKAETKPKSPNLRENPGIVATERDEMATKVTSVVGSNQTITKPAGKFVAGKESNSPADIKGERKVKGRPYWLQLACCSSAGSEA